MKRMSLILGLVALFLIAGVVVLRLLPPPVGAEQTPVHEDAPYLSALTLAQLDTLTLVNASGSSLQLAVKGDTVTLLDDNATNYDIELLSVLSSTALTLPALEDLGTPTAPLADYGLDTPQLTITLTTPQDAQIRIWLGAQTIDGFAYYAMAQGNKNAVAQSLTFAETSHLYLIDAELAASLLLPKEAYRTRQLWPGEQGERPQLTHIRIQPYNASPTSIVLRELASDNALGISQYSLSDPFSFPCRTDAVRVRIMDGLFAIDLDEVVTAHPASLSEYGLDHPDIVTLEGTDGFHVTLRIGGAAPTGGRYLMKDDDPVVYLDRLGDYGFLSVTPLDLTYALALWLYAFEDVAKISLTTPDGVYQLTSDMASCLLEAPDGNRSDVSNLNARRLFRHVLNVSVAALAETTTDNSATVVALHMKDGQTHTLTFTPQNVRQLAVSIDGAPPQFACNITDLQQIQRDFGRLADGLGIPEDRT